MELYVTKFELYFIQNYFLMNCFMKYYKIKSIKICSDTFKDWSNQSSWFRLEKKYTIRP